MNLNALRARLAELLAESETIAAAEAPTDEQVVRIRAIPGEMQAVRSQMEALDQIETVRAWAAAAQSMIPVADAVRSPSTPAPAAAAPDPSVRLWAVKRFGEYPAAAGQIASELYSDLSNNGSYEQVLYDKSQAFTRYLRTGQGATDRLARSIVLTPAQIINIAASGMSIRQVRAAMIEGSDELGGFIVPEDFREGIISRLPGLTVVRQRANVLSTSRDVLVMPRATGGNSRYPGNVRVTWVDEQPTSTEAATNATFGQMRLQIFTVMAHTDLSKNLVEDAVMDLGSYLSTMLTEATAIDEDEQFLVSAGAGKPQGVLNGTGANNAPHSSDVTVTNTGVAAALGADGFKKVPFNIAKQYRTNSAVWVMNKATLRDASILKDGEGRYLFPMSDLTGAAIPSSLLGYEVAESEAMPDVAANVHAVIFGDFKGYMIADRIGMSIQRYDDSTTAKQNSVVFVARRRLGGQVAEGWRLSAMKTAV